MTLIKKWHNFDNKLYSSARGFPVSGDCGSVTPALDPSVRSVRAETYSASGLVVVKVHQHARQFARVARIVLLFLSRVDETDGEPITVIGVVAAAAPDPIATQAGRSPASTAAARRQLAVAARP